MAKSSKNELEVYSILSMEMEAKGDMESFASSYMRDVLGQPVEKTKNIMRGLQLMEQAAEEGYPYALYGFARLLNEGIVAEPDGGKAWVLLQRLKTWKEGIHEKYSSGSVTMRVTKEENSTTTSYGSLENVLEYQLLDVVARHGDMPGITVKQAFDQFVKEHPQNGSLMYLDSESKNLLKAQFEKRGYNVSDKKGK